MSKFKLMKGDCLKRLKEIPDKSVDMILCDPPYGTTACKWDNVIPFEPMWNELKRITKDNGAICLFGSEPFSSHLRLSNLKNLKHDWYWKKEAGTGFLNAKKYPLSCIEVVSVFSDKPPKYYPQKTEGKPYKCKKGGGTDNYNKDSKDNIETINMGDRYPLNFLEFTRDRSKVHPTQKPVALLEYLIKTYTLENETVLDFTMGSGSTSVACKSLRRNFIGIEKEDKYYKIAVDRIKNFKHP